MRLRVSIPMRGHNRFATSVLSIALCFAWPAFAQSIDRAKQLFDEGKYAAARTELLVVQKNNDANASAAYYLGRLASFDNNFDDAIRQFERAVQLDDGNALYHFWLGSAVGDATPHANKLKQPFMARRVKKEWERAVQLDPNQIDARFRLVGFYVLAPGFMGGSTEKAREQANEISKRNVMRGAMARALIAEHEKNGAAQEAAYQQAISAAPDSSTGYFALANMYATNGKATEAFAALDQYAALRSDDRWPLYHIGRVSSVTGKQLDRGESALREFLAALPKDAHATTIAAAHDGLGQIEKKRGAKR